MNFVDAQENGPSWIEPCQNDVHEINTVTCHHIILSILEIGDRLYGELLRVVFNQEEEHEPIKWKNKLPVMKNRE
jgi:hypothetical protein